MTKNKHLTLHILSFLVQSPEEDIRLSKSGYSAVLVGYSIGESPNVKVSGNKINIIKYCALHYCTSTHPYPLTWRCTCGRKWTSFDTLRGPQNVHSPLNRRVFDVFFPIINVGDHSNLSLADWKRIWLTMFSVKRTVR